MYIYIYIYILSKLKRLTRIINMNNRNPCRTITFRENLTAWTQTNRIQGRPKNKWTDHALRELWTKMIEDIPEHRHITLYSNYYHRLLTPEAQQNITQYASTHDI